MAFDRKAYNREYARKRYQAMSPEQRKQRNSAPSLVAAKKRWRAKPENKAKDAAQCKRWYEKNREKKDLYNRCRMYGLSVEQYQVMLAAQHNTCAACQEPFRETPHIDHCHTSGCVRGLLCRACNVGLGAVKESLDRLEALIEYLKQQKVTKTA